MVKHSQAVGELWFQFRVTRREIDIVRGSGQGLQLAGVGAAGPAHIIDPQPLIIGKRVIELDGGCEVGIVTGHVFALGGIEAVEVHQLDPRPEVNIEFVVLDPVGDGQAVGIGSELIGIAEEAIEGHVFPDLVVEVIGIVDGPAVVIGIVVRYQQVGVLADRLRIVECRTDRPGMQGVKVMLVDGLGGIELKKGILGPIIPVAIVDVDGSGQVQGQGPVGFFELMPEGKI